MSGALCSVTLNKRARNRLASVEGITELIRYIRSMVDLYALPLPRILARMRSDGRCREFLVLCGYDPDKLPSDAAGLAESFPSELADREAGELFLRFLGEFGGTYRGEQVRICDHYIDAISARRETLAAELPARLKVNNALCVTGTLIPIILLI